MKEKMKFCDKICNIDHRLLHFRQTALVYVDLLIEKAIVRYDQLYIDSICAEYY